MRQRMVGDIGHRIPEMVFDPAFKAYRKHGANGNTGLRHGFRPLALRGTHAIKRPLERKSAERGTVNRQRLRSSAPDPSGLLAAIALAEGGIETALIGKPAPADHRTTALMRASVIALETLGVWDLCRENAAPLATLRIADATARLLRAPEARFEADGNRPGRLRLQYREPPSGCGDGNARARLAD